MSELPRAAAVTALELPPWPDDAQVAVSLTFDVDGETALQPQADRSLRLSSLSERSYGVRRGLPRILDSLSELGVRASFFVPGQTALLHPQAIEALLDAAHEIGHHGHAHLRETDLDDAGRRFEIEAGLMALGEFGIRPQGYRSPAWELTPPTYRLLLDHGFAYDSSLMGEDRPYLVGVEQTLVELPVHWSLDDVPFFWFDPSNPSPPAIAGQVLELWLAEFESAMAEGRHLVLTMHPEVIGRGHRVALIGQLVAEMRQRARVWFASCAEVAAFVIGGSRRQGTEVR